MFDMESATREDLIWLAEEAYRRIAAEYVKYPEAFEKPHHAIFDLAGIHEWNQQQWLATFLRAYGLHVQRGLKMIDIRETMIDRVQQGYSWRGVVMWSYKANRRR